MNHDGAATVPSFFDEEDDDDLFWEKHMANAAKMLPSLPQKKRPANTIRGWAANLAWLFLAPLIAMLCWNNIGLELPPISYWQAFLLRLAYRAIAR